MWYLVYDYLLLSLLTLIFRPLPEEMINYARDDTHYLLYIYDCMKNELLDKGNLEKNLLLSVYQRSKLVCQKVCYVVTER